MCARRARCASLLIFKYSGEQSHVSECADCSYFIRSLSHSLSLLLALKQNPNLNPNVNVNGFILVWFGLVWFVFEFNSFRCFILFSSLFLSHSLQLLSLWYIYLLCVLFFVLRSKEKYLNLALKTFHSRSDANRISRFGQYLMLCLILILSTEFQIIFHFKHAKYIRIMVDCRPIVMLKLFLLLKFFAK